MNFLKIKKQTNEPNSLFYLIIYTGCLQTLSVLLIDLDLSQQSSLQNESTFVPLNCHYICTKFVLNLNGHVIASWSLQTKWMLAKPLGRGRTDGQQKYRLNGLVDYVGSLPTLGGMQEQTEKLESFLVPGRACPLFRNLDHDSRRWFVRSYRAIEQVKGKERA